MQVFGVSNAVWIKRDRLQGQTRHVLGLELASSDQLFSSLLGGLSSGRGSDATPQHFKHRWHDPGSGGCLECLDNTRWQTSESSLHVVSEGRLGFGSSSSGLRDLLREGEGLGSSANAVEGVDLPLPRCCRLAVVGLVDIDPDPVAIAQHSAASGEASEVSRLGLEGVEVVAVQQVLGLHA
jgi:hypothetical protein